MIDSPAIKKRNVLIPLALNELSRIFQRIQKNKSPYIMFFIEKVGNFEFFRDAQLLTCM